MENSILVLFGSIFAAGVLLLLAIALSRSNKRPLNRAHYNERIREIEKMARSGDMNSLHMAVLNADKLFDNALKDRGFKGETMGERLKRANKQMKNPNGIWAAHKLRNRIAHEDKVNVTKGQAVKAVLIFRDGLRDLGAL